MFTLSVCLIVKDEEKVLERCLNCVKKFADEIVVVDTGSKDNTEQIAEKFTDKIYHFEWCDDFSQARNYSFSHATCDYIMWIDADDYITDENVQKINNLKNNMADVDIYMLKYEIAFDNQDQPTFSYYRERILKRNKNFIWHGFVHEVIVPVGKIEYADISIRHEKEEKVRDQGRNLKIYERHINNGEKLNARETFYYARELFYNDKTRKAEVYFKKFLKFKNAYLPNIIDAHLMLSKCYLQRDDFENARNILINSLQIASPTPEICCSIGEVFFRQRQLKKAIFWYKTALNCEVDGKDGAFVQQEYSAFIPYLQLSCIYYNLNNYDKFVEYHSLAKKLNPTHPSILYNEKFVCEEEKAGI